MFFTINILKFVSLHWGNALQYSICLRMNAILESNIRLKPLLLFVPKKNYSRFLKSQQLLTLIKYI
jgi:hypothetical protein